MTLWSWTEAGRSNPCAPESNIVELSWYLFPWVISERVPYPLLSGGAMKQLVIVACSALWLPSSIRFWGSRFRILRALCPLGVGRWNISLDLRAKPLLSRYAALLVYGFLPVRVEVPGEPNFQLSAALCDLLPSVSSKRFCIGVQVDPVTSSSKAMTCCDSAVR